MNREEKLKKSIEQIIPYSEGSEEFNAIAQYHRNGASIALSSPHILRHADPDVMKQAGWVRVQEELTNPPKP